MIILWNSCVRIINNWLDFWPTLRFVWLRLCLMVNQSSSVFSINSGVPQGSILGPILFLLFVNDLPDALQSQVALYADDSTLFCSLGRRDASRTELCLSRARKFIPPSALLYLYKTSIRSLFAHLGKCPRLLSSDVRQGTEEIMLSSWRWLGCVSWLSWSP